MVNSGFPKGSHRAFAIRHFRAMSERLSGWFWNAWFQAFPLSGPPSGPKNTPPLAKRAALSEGALLTEDVDAVSRRTLKKP
jgi:hypothetical protein